MRAVHQIIERQTPSRVAQRLGQFGAHRAALALHHLLRR